MTGRVRHATAGALVRLLDGQAGPAERKWVRVHVRDCALCGSRLSSLERQRAEVFARIAELDAEAPLPLPRLPRPRRLSRPRITFSPRVWAAVAAVVLLLAASVTAQPVRQWISERWDHATAPEGSAGADGQASAEPGAAPRPEEAPQPTAAEVDVASGARGGPPWIIAFLPRGDRFLVDVSERTASGSLVVRVEQVPSASVQIRGGDPQGVTIYPDRVLIARLSPDVRYEIVLPSTIRLIEARVAGEVLARMRPTPDSLPMVRKLEFGLRQEGS